MWRFVQLEEVTEPAQRYIYYFKGRQIDYKCMYLRVNKMKLCWRWLCPDLDCSATLLLSALFVDVKVCFTILWQLKLQQRQSDMDLKF